MYVNYFECPTSYIVFEFFTQFVGKVISIFTSGKNVQVPTDTSIWGNDDNISIIPV